MEEIRLTRGGRALAFLVALGLTSMTASGQAPPPSGKMWLLEEPPLEHIKEVYGVELTKEWLERAQLSANPGRVVDLVTLYRGGRVHPRAAARAARAELTGKSGSD